MSTPRQAVIYCRISRDATGEHLGVQRQESECRAVAERLGWEVVTVQIDNDLSASTGKRRPAYERTLEMFERGAADALVAWHPDRLHRRPIELERFIDICEARGVAIQTARAGEIDLSTPSGRMVARMLGAAARHETEQMSARLKARRAQLRESGEPHKGTRVFGYESDHVTIRETEATLIREAMTDLLAGRSLRAVVGRWNDAGVTGTRGKPWTTRNLRAAIMRSTRWAGYTNYRGELRKGTWDPIIDLDTLNAVRGLLADPARKTTQSTARKWLLSGSAIDGPTGRTVVCTKGKRGPIYIAKGQPSGSATHPAVDLDEYIGAVICERLARPDAADLIATDNGLDRAALRAERDGLVARRQQAATMFADGTIAADQLTAITAQLSPRIEAIDSQLADAEFIGHAALTELVEADDVAARWSELGIDQRSNVLRALLTVTLWPLETRPPLPRVFDPNKVEIEWITGA